MARSLIYCEEWNLRIMRPHFHQHLFGLGNAGGILRIRVKAEIFHCRNQDLVRRIEHDDTAIGEFRYHRRVEQHAQAVGRRVRHALFDLVRIEADAAGSPQVDHRMTVARVVFRQPFHLCRIEVFQVGDFASVERLQQFRLDLAGSVILGRHHDVVTGFSGQQLRFQGVVGIIDIISHPDSGFGLEVLQHVRIDVIRPVIDIDHLALGEDGQGAGKADGQSQAGGKDRTAHGDFPRLRPRNYDNTVAAQQRVMLHCRAGRGCGQSRNRNHCLQLIPSLSPSCHRIAM